MFIILENFPKFHSSVNETTSAKDCKRVLVMLDENILHRSYRLCRGEGRNFHNSRLLADGKMAVLSWLSDVDEHGCHFAELRVGGEFLFAPGPCRRREDRGC